MRFIAALTVLSFALPALADPEAPVATPAAAAAPSDARPLFARDEQAAATRGHGAMQIALAAVLIPVGLGIAGASVPIWDTINFHVFDSNCYRCDTGTAGGEIAGAVILGLVGLGMSTTGVWLLARGEQEYVGNKPLPLVVPVLRASADGGSAGLRLTF